MNPHGPLKVCVISSTRADYGHLQSLLRCLDADPFFELQLVVTGSHLSSSFGSTYREIESDGFRIARKFEIVPKSDTALEVSRSLATAVERFAESYAELEPGIAVVFGDRYEMLAAAQAALIARLPVAHLAGGDTTEGAYDEAFRHSITKMSHLHFATNAEAAARIRQLGENPSNVFDVGSTSLDTLASVPRLSRQELEAALDFRFRSRNLLVTFHPVTLAQDEAGELEEVLAALEGLGPETGIIITKPGFDAHSFEVIQRLERFCARYPNARLFDSLGRTRYFSAIREVDVVVGNSSSGLYEVPSFEKPTVNVGARQEGRLSAASVLNVRAARHEITAAIHRAYSMDCKGVVNPYGRGDAAQQIVEILKQRRPQLSGLIQKRFFS